MTVNILLLSQDLQVIGADCRFLSLPELKIETDSAEKVVTVSSSDLLLGIAYCGIGRVADLSTHDRIVPWLEPLNSQEHTLDHIVETLCRRLTEWLARVPAGDKRHCFSVVGYERGNPVACLISNFHCPPDFQEARVAGAVSLHPLAIEKPSAVIIGAEGLISRHQRHRLTDVIWKRRSKEEVIAVVGRTINELSRNPSANRRISANSWIMAMDRWGHSKSMLVGTAVGGFQPRSVDDLVQVGDIKQLLGLPKNAVVSQIVTGRSAGEGWREPTIECHPRVVRPRAASKRGQIRYQLHELPGLGGASSSARRVNNSGVVVGVSAPVGRGPSVACGWMGGRVLALGTLGGQSSYVTGLNNAGQAVGMGRNAADNDVPFRWTIAGGMEPLTVPPDIRCTLSDCNDSGDVIGTIQPITDRTLHGEMRRAFSARRNDELRVLEAVGAARSEATRMNNRGDIIGGISRGGVPRGFYYRHDGQCTFLKGTNRGECFLTDITDDGRVLGYERTPLKEHRVFIWSELNSYEMLPIIGNVIPIAIGPSNEILVNREQDGLWRALLCSAAGSLVLPYFGGHGCQAADINEQGTVVGQIFGEFHSHAVLWEPT